MPCTVHKSRWHLEHHGLVVALFMSVFTITCCATDAGCSIRVPDQASAKYTTVVSGVDAPAGPRSFTHGDNVTYRCIMNHWFAGPPASAVKTCVCSPTENCVPIPQPCVLRSPAVCKLLVSSSSTTKYSAWIADNQVSGNRSLSHGETVVYRCIAGHSFKTGKNVTACTCNQTSTCKTPEPCVKVFTSQAVSREELQSSQQTCTMVIREEGLATYVATDVPRRQKVLHGNYTFLVNYTLMFECLENYRWKTREYVRNISCDCVAPCEAPEPCGLIGVEPGNDPQLKVIGIVVGIVQVLSVLTAFSFGCCYISSQKGGVSGAMRSVFSSQTPSLRLNSPPTYPTPAMLSAVSVATSGTSVDDEGSSFDLSDY